MSGGHVDYDDPHHMLTVYDGGGEVVGIYPAANNAARGSFGKLDAGEYDYVWHAVHVTDAPNSAFGSNGNFIFDVPGCEDCGIHSGRAYSTDLAGRSGVEYATLGCILTTDEATMAILRLFQQGDPVRTLSVWR